MKYPFLEGIRSGRVQKLYSVGNHATHRHVDFVCQSGLFDAIWFDLEHFDIRPGLLSELCMVMRAYPMTPLARLYADNYRTVMRALESGAGGIICSMVESGKMAADIVSWARFNNPEPAAGEVTGRRGWNAGGPDARYGSMPPMEYMAAQNTQTVILCQIETEAGLENIEAIVSVDGVDGLFFGPGDFAHRIGRAGQLQHPEVVAAMEKVAGVCREQGKFWGTLGIGREMYERVRDLGAAFISPGGDVKVHQLGLKALSETFRDPES